MSEGVQLTPLGALLEAARGDMSIREAARRADISEGRWRQIVIGEQKAGGGLRIPARPRKSTVVKMAEAVGVPRIEALAAAGFEVKDEPARQPRSDRQVYLDVAEAIRQDAELLEEARQHLLRQYDMLVRLSRAERGPSSPVPEVRGRDLTDDEEAQLRAEEREMQRQRVLRRNADRDTDQGNRLGPTDNVGGAG